MQPDKFLGPSKLSFHLQTSKYILERKTKKYRKIEKKWPKIFCYVKTDVDWEAISKCFKVRCKRGVGGKEGGGWKGNSKTTNCNVSIWLMKNNVCLGLLHSSLQALPFLPLLCVWLLKISYQTFIHHLTFSHSPLKHSLLF